MINYKPINMILLFIPLLSEVTALYLSKKKILLSEGSRKVVFE